jgi:hypothetical protein
MMSKDRCDPSSHYAFGRLSQIDRNEDISIPQTSLHEGKDPSQSFRRHKEYGRTAPGFEVGKEPRPARFRNGKATVK